MNTKLSKDDAWDECPPGELDRMVGRVQAGRRKQTAIRGGIVSAFTLMLAITIWQALPMLTGDGQNNFGGISCHQVQMVLPQFLDDQLDEEMAEKVRLHLAECKICHPKAELMGWVAMRDTTTCNDANCPHCQQNAELLARGLIRREDASQLLTMASALPPVANLE